MEIKVKKLHKDARLPEYAHTTDAGMDFFALEDTVVPTQGHVMVPTGIAMTIPDGYAGLVWPKSGLAVKYGIVTLAGVIDSGYRGEIRIVIASTLGKEYVIHAGDKVAQMLIQKVTHPKLIESDVLDDTLRGEGGFGSTGV